MNPSLLDDAIALAGALAEAGVQTIEYRAADADWQSLAARTTDLPGLIVASRDGFELRWTGGGARIQQGQLKWWGVPGLPAIPQ
jgi:hypothetical protein